MAGNEHFQTLVAEVAAAYFANSHVSAAEIPTVIKQLALSLAAVTITENPVENMSEETVPARVKLTSAQINKSITSDALISFEDGKRYKTLRRHLATHGLTPEQYREKWGLPADYPMTSPSYSAARSAMAKSLGLGQIRAGQLGNAQPKPRGRPKGSRSRA